MYLANPSIWRTIVATALIVELDNRHVVGWEMEEPIRRLMSDVANDADQALRFDRREPAFRCIHFTAAVAHFTLLFSERPYSEPFPFEIVDCIIFVQSRAVTGFRVLREARKRLAIVRLLFAITFYSSIGASL